MLGIVEQIWEEEVVQPPRPIQAGIKYHTSYFLLSGWRTGWRLACDALSAIVSLVLLTLLSGAQNPF